MLRFVSPVLNSGLSGQKRFVLWAGVFSFAINVLTLAIPIYSMQIFNRVMASGSEATLWVLTVAVLGGVGAGTLLESIRSRLLIALGIEFDGKLATYLFEQRVENAGQGVADNSGSVIRDLDTVRHLLTGSGIIALFDVPWSPLFIFVCWYLHPVLGGLSFFGAVMVFGLAVLNQALVNAPLDNSAKKADASYRLTDNALQNAETVRALGMLPVLSERWSAVRDEAITSQAEASARNAAISSSIKFMRYSLQVAITAAGAWLAVNREITPGALYAASLISTRALMPIDQLVGIWRQLLQGWAALARVDAALAAGAPVRSMNLPRPMGRLAADALTYSLPGARLPTITKVDFAIEPGTSLGIVGPSAAGKSTLARLIVGAIKPSSGAVRLDGAETWFWNREDFGRHVGYVSQNIELFEGTIADNIARFKKANSLEIVEAAKMAGVHDMILALPQGYETVLMRNGAPLSGGQRQRIALARAVFGDPKLVVLDEPNSNLDGEGEAALMALLATLKARGTTVVMIAHRPSVLVNLDMVLVLQAGAVVNFGPIERVMPQIAPGFPIAQKKIVGRA